MPADEERLFRDDLAERRRERDREREPRSFRRTAPDHRARWAFQARQIDRVNQVLAGGITALECPSCLGPVFAQAGRAGDRIDCAGCDARLVTGLTDDGVVAILMPDGAP